MSQLIHLHEAAAKAEQEEMLRAHFRIRSQSNPSIINQLGPQIDKCNITKDWEQLRESGIICQLRDNVVSTNKVNFVSRS